METETNFCIEDAPKALREAFFPVSLQPLYWELDANQAPLQHQTTPFYSANFDNHEHQYQDYNYHFCPRHLALARLDIPYVYQCVTSDNYELFTNADAVKAANVVAINVFKVNSLLDLPDSQALIYGTLDSKCSMDFCDHKHNIKLIGNDTWTPFLRIFNSYTYGTAIYYNFGFSMCFYEGAQMHQISAIFEDICINVKETHALGVSSRIEKKLENDLKQNNMNDIEQIKERFKNIMIALDSRAIKRVDILPVALKLFGIKEINTDEQKQKCRYLFEAIQKGAFHFMNEPDSFNAYNLFRVLAYVVSKPLDYFTLRTIDGFDENFKFQSKLGSIVIELYNTVCCNNKLLREHIGEKYYELAERIM